MAFRGKNAERDGIYEKKDVEIYLSVAFSSVTSSIAASSSM
jgi:hypothetical protein